MLETWAFLLSSVRAMTLKVLGVGRPDIKRMLQGCLYKQQKVNATPGKERPRNFSSVYFAKWIGGLKVRRQWN